jgi:hypothetical protein
MLIESDLMEKHFTRAERRCDILDDLLRQHNLRLQRPYAAWLRGRLALGRGRGLEANRYFQRAKDQLQELMAEMPQAHQEGYLKDRWRRLIVEDAEHQEVSERGGLLLGMRRILEIAQVLVRAQDQGIQATLSAVLDQIVQFTQAERGILFRLLPGEGDAEQSADVVHRAWDAAEAPLWWKVETPVARNFSREDLDRRRQRASKTVLRRILEHDKPVFSSDALEDPRLSQSGSVLQMQMR